MVENSHLFKPMKINGKIEKSIINIVLICENDNHCELKNVTKIDNYCELDEVNLGKIFWFIIVVILIYQCDIYC